MSGLKVRAFSISADGYGAGPEQSLQNPLGQGGATLHEWVLPTQTFRRRVLGLDGGSTGADDGYVRRSFDGIGAWILGRNMFGPVRGPWPDDAWKGWWGDAPPYGVPVYVLTHHARAPLEMKGGTSFHFVTGGIDEALARARSAAAGRDVRLGGGVATVRQCLQAGLIDEMHVAIAPTLLGRGEALLAGIDLPALGFRVVERCATERALHVVMRKDGAR